MPNIYFVKRTSFAVLILVVFQFFLSCTPSTKWVSKEGLSHPLVGKIWDPNNKRYISQNDLITELKKGSVVALGEKHDNPDHHKLQALLIRKLTISNKYPTLGMEQLREEDMPSLLKHFNNNSEDISQLGTILKWEEQGWPSFSIYQPIFEAAREARLFFIPLGLKSNFGKEKKPPLMPNNEVESLLLKFLLPLNEKALLEEEIFQSHCQKVPKEFASRMVETQRRRDIYMAVQAAKSDGVIIIAGNGHARRDRGIPFYLSQLTPKTSVVTLGFIEVQEGRVEPSAYSELIFAEKLPFDFVWFTPVYDPSDPCEKFSEALKKFHKNTVKN